MAVATIVGSDIDRSVAHAERSTTQHAVVYATPEETYRAIWAANLLSTSLARMLSALAIWPERLRARLRHEPSPPRTRSARLRDTLGEGSPWILLTEEPGNEIVLGLLWTPPAGGTKCDPEEFAGFSAPGLAKVAWSLSVQPFGAGHTLLTTRTRTSGTDAAARRRVRLIWPFIALLASLLRTQVLCAIKTAAESRP
jgi:hypothetical protein